jgi:hypothetical protein
MSKTKNYLDLKSKNTFVQSTSSRSKKIDGVYKKEKILKPASNIVDVKLEKKQVQTVAVDKSTVDENKRMFMKVAGVAGIGLAAGALFPKSAEAYVAGSTPTSNVVGSKDASNVRINPAKEDGNLATIAGKDFATQTTLAAMKAKTDQLTFDGSNNLLTASTGGASEVNLKDTTDTQINPATEDSMMLLRRILRQVDSLGVVDSAQRQKVTIDSITGSLTLGTITTVGTVSTVTSATNLVALGGVDGRYLYIDTARNASANGIRNNLLFS